MLYNALYNYGPAISLDFYLGFITENEGPYDISDIFGEGHILVIKKFWNLKPTEIFPHTSNYPYNSITIYCVYKNKSHGRLRQVSGCRQVRVPDFLYISFPANKNQP